MIFMGLIPRKHGDYRGDLRRGEVTTWGGGDRGQLGGGGDIFFPNCVVSPLNKSKSYGQPLIR